MLTDKAMKAFANIYCHWPAEWQIQPGYVPFTVAVFFFGRYAYWQRKDSENLII